MARGTSKEDRLPLLAVGAGVGILIGVASVIFAGAVFDGDNDPGPVATTAEVERAAASIDRIQRHCGARTRGRPSGAERIQAQRALAELLRDYRRQPEKRYRRDDSDDPVPLDDSLYDLVFNTFDGPCPEIARRAKTGLLRTP